MDETASTGELLLGAARSLRRGFMGALAEHEVTPAQARALRVVCEAEDAPRLSHVAERLRVAPRSATEVVDALEGAGLVERISDTEDRRAVRVRATEAGRRLTKVIDRTRRREAGRFLAALTEHDQDELHRILEQLADTR